MRTIAKLPMLWLLTVLLLLGSLGCSDGLLDEQAQQVIAGGGDSPEVRVATLDPTPVDVLDALAIDVTPGGGGFDVSVAVTAELVDTRDLYISVDYDANQNRAEAISFDAGAEGSVIGLAVEAEPGVIEFGATAVGADAVLPADTALMSFKLLPGGDERAVSAAPSSKRAMARNLELSQGEDGRWTLSWDYTNPGDNNQDGIVGVTDLTQIGQNFLAKVANSWDDPLRHIDSNHDGEINVTDITAIGQNYNAEIFSYQIEMFDELAGEYITVGQLLLGEQDVQPGQTVRFSYTFGPQYVERGWYRVASLDRDLQFGTPSEEISEQGRRVAPTGTATGQVATITVYANDLPHSISQLNCLRVVYPNTFSYVAESANVGSPGGARSAPDGIWASFASGVLFPDEFFFQQVEMGGGRLAIDFNVTTLLRDLPGAPVGYGDLLNFQLKSDSGDELVLEFQEVSEDGIWRTYYSDADVEDHFFGNAIGFSIM